MTSLRSNLVTSLPTKYLLNHPILTSLSNYSTMSTEILHDYFPLLRVYKHSRVERLVGEGFTPPGIDPETGVQSKDVVISPKINLSARIYLPKDATAGKKLPLLVFFHGGGFVIESAFSPQYHRHLNLQVAEANVVAVSVNYRLAPEHPLPIAHEDSWLAIKWVAENSDDWIKNYADFDRVFFTGDSAGGNLAHHMAIRAGLEKLDGINLRGIILNCPYFWGKDPIGKEVNFDPTTTKFTVEDLWKYSCPGTLGCDDPIINPGMDPKLSSLGCKRVLVYVGEKDFLRDRGLHYKEQLEKSGWEGEIEVVDVEGESHVFSVLTPHGENGKAMLKKVGVFINQ